MQQNMKIKHRIKIHEQNKVKLNRWNNRKIQQQKIDVYENHLFI